jgi:LPXTG-motif cell wall-anchored protein
MHRSILVRWGSAGVLSVAMLWPISAANADHGDPHPETTCREVLDGDPGHELEKDTDPSDGSDVRAGQVIEVRMTWKANDFTDAPLDVVLDCVTVDGRLDTALSGEERGALNDGEFTHRYTVPDGLPAGTEICDRGGIAGDGRGYFELNKSNDVCFTVVETREEQATPPPPSPPPTVPLPPSVTPPPAAAPPVVEGVTEEHPVPAPAPAPPPPPPAPAAQPEERLPRTGEAGDALVLLAGVLLAIGGAAVMGSVKPSLTRSLP